MNERLVECSKCHDLAREVDSVKCRRTNKPVCWNCHTSCEFHAEYGGLHRCLFKIERDLQREEVKAKWHEIQKYKRESKRLRAAGDIAYISKEGAIKRCERELKELEEKYDIKI